MIVGRSEKWVLDSFSLNYANFRPYLSRMLLLASSVVVGWEAYALFNLWHHHCKKNYGWCHVNSKLMSLISIGILLCPTGSSDNLWSRVKFGISFSIHIESVSQFTNRPDHKNVCASFKNVYESTYFKRIFEKKS